MSAPQLDAAQWRMLCAIARDVVVAARSHGSETALFRGYRVAARRIETGSSPGIEVTVNKFGRQCQQLYHETGVEAKDTAAR